MSDFHKLWDAAIAAANKKAPDYTRPDFAWVGPGFVARYLTYCWGRAVSETEALEWLEEHAEYDESVGCWRIGVIRNPQWVDGIPIKENPVFDDLDNTGSKNGGK